MLIRCASRPLPIVLLLLTVCLTGQPDPAASQGRTQKVSARLVERAEDMVKDVGKTRAQVARAVGKYDDIFRANKLKDRQKAYKSLLKEIRKTEDMVKEVRTRAERMQKEADKFFNEWSKGLAKVTDNELRLLGHQNMTEGRERYGNVVESGLRAGSLYTTFLSDLKNQCSYLEVDVSDTAMARLEPSRAQASERSKALYQSVDELTKTTKAYIDSMK